MITQLFTELGSIITGLMTSLTSSLTGLVDVFYIEEGGFTFLGSLLLIGFGLFFVMFAWKVIQGLIKR